MIDKHTVFWYVLHWQAAKVLKSLCTWKVLPEPPLLVYTKFESRCRLRPQALLDTPAWALKRVFCALFFQSYLNQFKRILLDFLLTVKAATLIFISGCG